MKVMSKIGGSVQVVVLPGCYRHEDLAYKANERGLKFIAKQLGLENLDISPEQEFIVDLPPMARGHYDTEDDGRLNNDPVMKQVVEHILLNHPERNKSFTIRTQEEEEKMKEELKRRASLVTVDKERLERLEAMEKRMLEERKAQKEKADEISPEKRKRGRPKKVAQEA